MAVARIATYPIYPAPSRLAQNGVMAGPRKTSSRDIDARLNALTGDLIQIDRALPETVIFGDGRGERNRDAANTLAQRSKETAAGEFPPDSPQAARKVVGRMLAKCERAFDLLLKDGEATNYRDYRAASLVSAARVAQAAAALGVALHRLSTPGKIALRPASRRRAAGERGEKTGKNSS